ncbi:hypothetical protein COCSUDRAFT_47016 [Coccomyxa subellipsoidea C-169]|uniref:Nucleolar protein 11 C-terminal domain-containing protein n=1 Tax=Coccomyxa subellipsoidea (strain C-169) TaxID=574566 RepID=I0Z2S0_COCSC|nr:hypothetical protein COCSUDRAFT_47016 [Coccomyxa subellipsoidea C-169]EIE24939.1 hypothetical protein COCSUDRAFT_47016 [Coccomyxa subellipsoidea C-169]|eukprot:XP_005649483.1 hypothetical protein COCSUDRAFT_47016 [Coccomyxa subellipsoidea C-169]
MVGALSPDNAVALQPSRALAAAAAAAAEPPPHDHSRPAWARIGAAAALPLRPHVGDIAVPLELEHIQRWERAAAAIAEDHRFEREAAAQLAQPGSLPTADVAAQLVQDIMQRTAASGGVPSQQLLQKLVERCAESGYWEVLHGLAEQRNLAAFERCPSLVASMAESGQYRLLACALCQAVDMSPADVAAALEVLLAERTRFPRELCAWQRHYSEAAESAVAAAESSIGMEGLHEAALASAQAVVAAVEGFTPQEVCLHAMVAGGHDNAVVLAALRKLRAPQVLRLTAYLSKWATHQPGAVSHQPSTLPLGVALPTLGDALRWAAAVLDAHFVTLAGQPKQALTALLALQEQVADDVKVSQKVAALGGVLDHISRQAPLPTFSSAAAQVYSVELLDLRVRSAG